MPLPAHIIVRKKCKMLCQHNARSRLSCHMRMVHIKKIVQNASLYELTKEMKENTTHMASEILFLSFPSSDAYAEVIELKTTEIGSSPHLTRRSLRRMEIWKEAAKHQPPQNESARVYAATITGAPPPTSSTILPATADGYPRDSISWTTPAAPERSSTARKARVIASYVLGSRFPIPTLS